MFPARRHSTFCLDAKGIIYETRGPQRQVFVAGVKELGVPSPPRRDLRRWGGLKLLLDRRHDRLRQLDLALQLRIGRSPADVDLTGTPRGMPRRDVLVIPAEAPRLQRPRNPPRLARI